MRRRRALAPWLLPLLLIGPLLAEPGEAARQFNGTTDRLQSAAVVPLSSATKLTLSFWLWIDSSSDTYQQAVAGGVTSNPPGSVTTFVNSAIVGRALFGGTGNVGQSTRNFARPSAAAWHHYVMVMDFGLATHEVSAVYVDGVSQSLADSVNFDNTGTFADFTWYFMSSSTPGLFDAGRLAEVAIWPGYTFVQGDVDALYNAGACNRATAVQAASLAHYWPINGTQSPEPSVVGGVNLTVTGTTFVAHPCTFPAAPGSKPPGDPRSRSRLGR